MCGASEQVGIYAWSTIRSKLSAGQKPRMNGAATESHQTYWAQNRETHHSIIDVINLFEITFSFRQYFNINKGNHLPNIVQI